MNRIEMETPKLDKEIEWLEWAKNGTNWNEEREKQLAEYKAIKQALRIHDVVGRSELLPKRLSNTAYRNAQSMTYAEFVGWWDEQV